jgi:lactate dehydrogenase-like 2-hydroxyacid dehydrogenase
MMKMARTSNIDSIGTTPIAVLQVGALLPSLEAALSGEFDVLRLPETETDDFLAKFGSEITIAVTSGAAGVKGDVIRALPSLQAIVNFGVGYDATDVAVASERGVVVSNTPDVLTDCTADLAVGILIDLFRNISAADRFVRRGLWVNDNFPLSSKVSGKRVGIVGLGRIGRAIAQRLVAFNITVSYHNRKPVEDVPYAYAKTVRELALNCDALIIATTGGKGTKGLISREVLVALGPEGYLVNIARGSIVDEEALVEALVHGTIAGAGLDVLASEPHVPPALLELENVVLLPHVGSGTVETRQAMADLVMANLRQFTTEGTLKNPVPMP